MAGKSRSARNAAKHGLSLSVLQDPILAPEVARLAAAITGGRDELLELAIPIAGSGGVAARPPRAHRAHRSRPQGSCPEGWCNSGVAKSPARALSIAL